MQLVKKIDKLINDITMYRLLLYGLSLLVIAAIILSLCNILPLSAGGIATSAVILLITCYVANWCLATLWDAPSNSESWVITALILCCILPPTTSLHHGLLVGAAGLAAMGSKYLIALHHKHLFNPAAFGAVVLGVSGLLPAIWWIGSSSLLPLTIIFGLVVLRKVRRFQLFFFFAAASLVVALFVGHSHSQSVNYILQTALKSSPLIFLGSVMLTEPETLPPLLWQQRLYGIIVGLIFTSQLRVGSISATPELALVIGNLFAYVVSPKYRFRMRLKSKRKLAAGYYDFGFTSNHPVAFKPGQYLEWTLGHEASDGRGNRRTFSIASAPGDAEVHVAVKITEPGSSFKKALQALNPGDSVVAGQLSGNFILPTDHNIKLVFIAGGIGITPFVSMVRDMILAKQRRDITLFYFVASPADICYQELWSEAKAFGLQFIPVLSDTTADSRWNGQVGRLSLDMLEQTTKQYKERSYYLSGPNALVENYRQLLLKAGISRRKIRTDHFSGY